MNLNVYPFLFLENITQQKVHAVEVITIKNNTETGLLYLCILIQWRSSAPKSGGHKLFFQKSEKQKTKVAAA